MKVIHTADLHLGFRQFTKVGPGGTNQREIDVANTFTALIDRVIPLDPDLFVIAGDVFHSPRPPNSAVIHFHRQLSRLRVARPRCAVVIAAGNHDLPATAESACILGLFAAGASVRVAVRRPVVFDYPDRDLVVVALPEGVRTVPENIALSGWSTRVLVVHGQAGGIVPIGPEENLDPSMLTGDEWDYVALGHWHVHRQVGPRAYYAGSIDYTSSNIWGECEEESRFGLSGKGFVEFDTETSTLRWHELPRSRLVLDFPVIDATGKAPADLSTEIMEYLSDTFDVRGAIVRQRVTNCPQTVSRELDHKAIRALAGLALHYQLDVERPDRPSIFRREPGQEHATPRILAERLHEYLTQCDLAPDIDRETFVREGLNYLAAVNEP